MKIQQAVLVETRKISIGVLLLSVIMVMAFIGLGYYDATVMPGAALGAVGAVSNFFLMALTVQKITEQIHGVRKVHPANEEEKKIQEPDEAELNGPEEEDPLTPEEEADLREQTLWAKKKMQRSYALRMLMVVAFGVVGLKVSFFHPVAVLVPFLFPRVVITIKSLLTGKKGA